MAQCGVMAAHIWVECAECSKWRRVPPLSDEGARWRCADNADARFASCAAPQELSDDEIDAQLKAQARPARAAHAVGLLSRLFAHASATHGRCFGTFATAQRGVAAEPRAPRAAASSRAAWRPPLVCVQRFERRMCLALAGRRRCCRWRRSA